MRSPASSTKPRAEAFLRPATLKGLAAIPTRPWSASPHRPQRYPTLSDSLTTSLSRPIFWPSMPRLKRREPATPVRASLWWPLRSVDLPSRRPVPLARSCGRHSENHDHAHQCQRERGPDISHFGGQPPAVQRNLRSFARDPADGRDDPAQCPALEETNAAIEKTEAQASELDGSYKSSISRLRNGIAPSQDGSQRARRVLTLIAG
jgi:hypothetical protein